MNRLSTSEKMISAFADFTRIRLIRLFEASKIELCVCDLTIALNEPTYKLSRHLKVLRQVGVLSATKEGRWLYHRLVKRKPHLENLCSLVASLPDENRKYASDRKRLLRLLEARGFTKCRTGRPSTEIISSTSVELN